MLLSELDLKIPNPDPMKCIVRVANKAGLNEKTKRIAMDIMDDVTKREISAGKDPMGMAATVLYISCLNTGEKKTQKLLAIVLSCYVVTLPKECVESFKDKFFVFFYLVKFDLRHNTFPSHSSLNWKVTCT